MIKTTYKYTQDKNLVWNQILYLIRHAFSYSNCGSSPAKTCANKQTLFEKNSGSQRARTSDLWISSLTHSRLSQAGWYVEWDLNFYCTVLYIATVLYVASMHNHAIVAPGMYNIIFIKTKYSRWWNLKFICSHLLAHAHTFSYNIIMYAWHSNV